MPAPKSKFSGVGFLFSAKSTHLCGEKFYKGSTESKIFHKRLYPGYLEPSSVKILSVRDKIPPVNIVQPTVGINASDAFLRNKSIKGTVEALHYLF
jgi:hypothetical protein